MTRAPHEIAVPGPAADFAARLSAQLPVIETARLRLRAPSLADFDAWAEIFTGPAGPHLGGPFSRDEASPNSPRPAASGCCAATAF
jgi:hypothetical protein